MTANDERTKAPLHNEPANGPNNKKDKGPDRKGSKVISTRVICVLGISVASKSQSSHPRD